MQKRMEQPYTDDHVGATVDEHLDAEAGRSAPTLTLMQQYDDHLMRKRDLPIH